jgi:hypothetical protein
MHECTCEECGVLAGPARAHTTHGKPGAKPQAAHQPHIHIHVHTACNDTRRFSFRPGPVAAVSCRASSIVTQ